MPSTFSNRVRLPFKLDRAQFPTNKTVFRKSNGVTKVLSVVVRKTYQGETDYLPEMWHQRLRIALAHDNVTVEGDRYVGLISQEGEYNINWVDFKGYPTAKAEFVAEVTPFNATNSNCMTCEQSEQLDAVDDFIEETLEEGGQYEKDVSVNDTVCCYPAVYSISSFDSVYLYAASIDPATGIISIELNTGLVSGNNIPLLTYRVTCPDGSYDEAQVFGTVNGTIVGCYTPDVEDFVFDLYSATAVTISWADPAVTPDSYYWELYAAADIGTAIQSGTAALGAGEAVLTGLLEGVAYQLSVFGVCGGVNSATSADLPFTTPTDTEEGCGRYNLEWTDGTGNPTHYAPETYINCNGDTVATQVFNGVLKQICALENSSGEPIYIVGAATVTRSGSCAE